MARRVQSDPHFGGIVVHGPPDPHVVVMFTGDAEARLRSYTSDPRYRARRVDLTLSQLEAMKDDVGSQIAGLDIRCFTVDADELHNTVTVVTPYGEAIRQAAQQRRLTLPQKFRLLSGPCVEAR